MSPKVLYRIAAIVLVLFAAGHTAGFLSFKPASPEGLAVMSAMNSVAFDFNGAMRTYSNFYVGFGLQVTAFLLFCAFVSWHLGELAASQPKAIGGLGWAFALVQLATLVLSVRYFFIVPTVMTAVVLLCSVWAAWRVRSAAA